MLVFTSLPPPATFRNNSVTGARKYLIFANSARTFFDLAPIGMHELNRLEPTQQNPPPYLYLPTLISNVRNPGRQRGAFSGRLGPADLRRRYRAAEIKNRHLQNARARESGELETVRTAYGSGRVRTGARRSPPPGRRCSDRVRPCRDVRFARHVRSSQNRMGPGGFEPPISAL